MSDIKGPCGLSCLDFLALKKGCFDETGTCYSTLAQWGQFIGGPSGVFKKIGSERQVIPTGLRIDPSTASDEHARDLIAFWYESFLRDLSESSMKDRVDSLRYAMVTKLSERFEIAEPRIRDGLVFPELEKVAADDRPANYRVSGRPAHGMHH